MLKTYLESQGKKVFYFHAVDFSLANKIFFWKHKQNKKTDTGITQSSRFQIFLRKLFLRLDIWRFDLLQNKLRKDGYDYILSDRFFDDSIININYLEEKNRNLEFPPEINKTPPKNIIKNSIIIYLQTNPEIIIQRKRKPEQGFQYLLDKKKLYDQHFRNIQKAKIIDGNRTQEEIFEKIQNSLA